MNITWNSFIGFVGSLESAFCVFEVNVSLLWLIRDLSLNCWPHKFWKYCFYFLFSYLFWWIYFVILYNTTMPQSKVWQVFSTEEWVVLLRILYIIGWSSPLKHQYLNQVEKKVREKTHSSLSVAPLAHFKTGSSFFVFAFKVSEEIKEHEVSNRFQ